MNMLDDLKRQYDDVSFIDQFTYNNLLKFLRSLNREQILFLYEYDINIVSDIAINMLPNYCEATETRN